MKSKPLSLLAGAMLAFSLATMAPTNALADEASPELVAFEETTTVPTDDAVTEEPAQSDEGQGQVTDVDVSTPEVEPVVDDGQDQAAPVEGDVTVEEPTLSDGDEELLDPEAPAEETQEPEEEAPAEEESKDDEATSQANDPSAQKELDQLAAEHAKDLPEGRYEIVSNAKPATEGDTAGYALDVRGGKKTTATNTAEAILYTEEIKDAQRWDITYVGGGYALIKSAKTGQYLTLLGGEGAYDNGSAQVVLWDHKPGALYQQWIIIKESDGSFKLVSAWLKNGTEMCVLDVRGGKAKNSAKCIAYAEKTSGNIANQRWTIRVTNDILDAEAQEHSDDLPDGTYLVASSVNSNLVLNVRRNSKDDGGQIILYPDDTVTVNDGWDIVHNANGYITIISSSSGKVLDVRGGKAKDGATVFQWADKQAGARNQLWIAVMETDGSYTFTSALAGDVRYVLSVASAKSGAATTLRKDKSGLKDNQHWVLSQAPEQYAYAHVIADGTYLIRTVLDVSKVLDVSRNSKDSGAQVKLYTCKLSDNQFWILSHDSQGYVRFKNKNSGLYLAFTSKAVDGSILTVQTTKATKWVVESSDDGSYVIRDPKTGRCIDLSRNSTKNGAKVIAYKATNGKNQRWQIAPARKIALDPGHGGNDSGAVGNGLRECDLTWSITMACAEQLRAYGFEVFITIEEKEFKSGATVGIQERVRRASDAGCVAIFSLHINSGGGTGAVALVPNKSTYHADFYDMGQSFAKNLMSNFNAVGMGTWSDGAWERDFKVSEGASEAQYYNGSGGLTGTPTSYGYADYYGIVRYARLKGMFGVIIEHGFIDNAHDATILGTATGRQALAKADADAIKALYV